MTDDNGDETTELSRHAGRENMTRCRRLLLRTVTGAVALTMFAGMTGCHAVHSVSLEDFTGNWVVLTKQGALSADDRILRLRLNGTRLSGLIDGQSGRADLGDLQTDTVTGNWLTGASSMAMTAQINADGDRKELKLTLAPPESEYIRVTAWKEGRTLSNGTVVKLPTSAAHAPSGPIRSPDDAIARVAALPDVAAWVQKVQDSGLTTQAVLDIDSETKTAYVVHAYEFVDDGNGSSHTATFGWYDVIRKTGAVHRRVP